MKNCIYFVENPCTDRAEAFAAAAGGPVLRPGFGFRADGSWRPLPLPPDADGLLLDDRFLPDARGLETALRTLDGWPGSVILDFERQPAPPAAQLAQALAGRDLVVPPAYADLAPAAVLIGPWAGGPFAPWLDRQQARYGSVVLDALPLRRRALPGASWEPWAGPAPEAGFPCPGAGCLHRRAADGALLFWDTQGTLSARCQAAGVPCIVFAADWRGLTPPPRREAPEAVQAR